MLGPCVWAALGLHWSNGRASLGKDLPFARPIAVPGERPPEIEVEVKVRVQVSNTGNPIHIKVTQSSGHISLDNAFIRAVKQYTFKPKRVMGKNVKGSIALAYTFQIGANE